MTAANLCLEAVAVDWMDYSCEILQYSTPNALSENACSTTFLIICKE